MATATRTRRGKAAEPVEEESAETNGGVRAPSELHELMADYFNENYDAGVTPKQCVIFTSKRTEFRKSDEYVAYRERNAEGTEERKTAKASRATKAAAEPEDDEDEPKPARRRTPPARKAAAEAAPAAKPAPARRTRRTGKAEAEDAAPAEEAPKPAARRRRSAKPAAAATEEEPF